MTESPEPTAAPAAPLAPSHARIGWEVAIVLALGLGQSAVYSVVQLLDLLTRPAPLGDQSTTLNPSVSPREWLDLTYQLLDNAFAVAPVLLACWLVWSVARPHLGRLGMAWDRPWRDFGWSWVLVLAVGVPGIGVYLAGRALGVTVAVDPTGLGAHWYTIPVLLLSAARSGIQEEVVMIGYLFDRLRAAKWNDWWIIVGSAAVRGTYHLYQGFGAWVGNFAMGLLFGWIYRRWGRLLPLVFAHALIDAIIFVGYPFVAPYLP